MTGRPTIDRSLVPPWTLAVGAMLSVQFGSALSVPLIDEVGTVPVAALTAAVPGIPQAAGHVSVGVVLTAAGLALLFPVLQYALDLLALRHMTQTAFGTLMALEPAVGVLLGLILLSQEPSRVQLLGVALVVVAGAAAQRGGRRTPRTDAAAHGDQPALPLLALEPK